MTNDAYYALSVVAGTTSNAVLDCDAERKGANFGLRNALKVPSHALEESSVFMPKSDISMFFPADDVFIALALQSGTRKRPC